MAVNIKFDLSGNPEPPTIILANRSGNKFGQLEVNADSIELNDKFNDVSELSFTMNKYIDDKLTPLWDKVVDFKLIYCKEWDCWFEIKVELDEATETIKTVFCTQLGQAELSQIMLYNIEINTEADIERDDYKISILYDPIDSKASILNRLLEKAPHYSIAHVDSTITKIQRSFSFDGTSIHDAFNEISEEIGCLFVYGSNSDENGMPNRTISVYDLWQNCNNEECGHRGEFTDMCPKCGGTDIKYGYGDDTTIFVTSDELATEGIQLTTDGDSVKNCFKLEAGDDLMTATIRNCNPNGTDYIWRFSNGAKEDMSDDLVNKIESYDELYKQYYNEYVSNIDTSLLNNYNLLVDKYVGYNEDLQKIISPIIGYPNLMNAYYNTIDLALYLKSGLMPNIKMSETNAKEQANLLTSSSLSPVAVNVEKAENISLATANSAVLSMAKIIVKSTYKVEIKTSTLSDNKIWEGSFVITNYSDEEDVADSEIIKVTINNDTETFIKQKIDKALNKENTDDYSITGLFKKDYDTFCIELKRYGLNPLKSFYEACDACLDILIDQGAGNKDDKPDLYTVLYEPYYNKSSAIATEIKVREDEIAIIEGVWDKTDEKNSSLITKGLQTDIQNCRNAIQTELDFEKYIGKDLWSEFCSYRREDKYTNDNYISDGLNNADLFKRALEFFEIAENEIYKSSETQYSISTSLNNLLAIDKFKPLVGSFDVGNWIRVRVDDKIFKLRLLKYDINFDDFSNITVEFSNVTKIKNGTTDVRDILSRASSMATSYSSVKRQATQGNEANDTVEQWTSNGLNTADVQLQNNSNEEVVMSGCGILCRSYDDITKSYLPEQLKLTHNMMAYTDDNWKTVKQAIGKHEYRFYDEGTNNFVDGVGYGVTSRFLNTGFVSGSQIIGGNIYSDNYYNSESNKVGSHLNLKDGTFSFAGGKLVYDGEYLSVDGKITIATEGTIGCWSVNKDAIYRGSDNFNDSEGMYFGTYGLKIKNSFKVTSEGKATMTGASVSGDITATSGYFSDCVIDESCTISGTLQIGNVDDGYSAWISSENGVLKAQGAVIEGDITATSGDIGGWTIDEEDIYSGDYNFTGIHSGETSKASVANQGSDCPIRFYAGASSRTSYGLYNAPFQVLSDGSVYASAFCSTDGTTSVNIIDGFMSQEQTNSYANFIATKTAAGSIYSSDAPFAVGIAVSSGGSGYGGIFAGDSNTTQLSDLTRRICFTDTANYTEGTWLQSSANSTTSDINKKHSISDIPDAYRAIFANLKPKIYKYNDGTSDRFHVGFIAQEVEEAIIASGLTTQDFAGFVKAQLPNVETGEIETIYMLRYEEFIALNTLEIQKLNERIDRLESLVKEK